MEVAQLKGPQRRSLECSKRFRMVDMCVERAPFPQRVSDHLLVQLFQGDFLPVACSGL